MSALLLSSPLTADAVEFDAVPVITATTECRAATPDVPGGMVVTLFYENQGAGIADFHEVTKINNLTFEKDLAVGDAPATTKLLFLEDQVASVTVTSNSGSGATYTVSFNPVDCVPQVFHLTVSKKVIGGSGDPAFEFEVVCHPAEGPEYVLAEFSLHDGESQSVDFPDADPCYVDEKSPGAEWVVTQSINGDGFGPPTHDMLLTGADQTMDFINTAKTPPTTDSTTSVVATTVPGSTQPSTSPSSTVLAAGIVPTPGGPTPGPVGVELPSTGTSNGSMALFALVLLGAGSTLTVLARRRIPT